MPMFDKTLERLYALKAYEDIARIPLKELKTPVGWERAVDILEKYMTELVINARPTQPSIKRGEI